jgi:uncharacterized protein (DUF302 family)
VLNKKGPPAYASDLRLNMALPCRILVFTERGVTKIGSIKPARMLSVLSNDPALREIANDVEDKTIQMIDNSK